ncbi:hypothetical protein MKW92_016612 [Papaver armeniacum]|nr:hypothetical protein MKW92_016612 [Papaver armeniacum]
MAIQLENQFYASNFKLKYKPQNHQLIKFNRSLCIQAAASISGKKLVQSGTVKAISPKEAIPVMNNEGFLLLDIRPIWEREKAHIPGTLHVPLFIKDEDYSILTLLKKWVHFGYIGLWTGQKFTTINPTFLSQVESSVPNKDEKLLVVCGEGLRSLMAISNLHEGGYRNLGWLIGGFNQAKVADFPSVEGTDKILQYATIGGVSYYFLQLLNLIESVGKKDS